jgi:DNA-binding transcriptional LysR family regulator
LITDGVGLNITVFSYRGNVDFAITADRASIPDAWPLMEALPRALDELRTVVAPTPPLTHGRTRAPASST